MMFAYKFPSQQEISAIMQDGSTANQSVFLGARALLLEEHWIVLEQH